MQWAVLGMVVLSSFLFKSAVVNYYFTNMSAFAISYVLGTEEEEEETVHSAVSHFSKIEDDLVFSFSDSEAVESHRSVGSIILYRCDQGEIPIPPPDCRG